jgi:hypothetical protein
MGDPMKAKIAAAGRPGFIGAKISPQQLTSGSGVQMQTVISSNADVASVASNGIAYLIPVDATLERDTHVSDETVPLSRVLEKVESAHKLRLVILDACRNNPFVDRMVRSAGLTRSIGHRLAAIEPDRACVGCAVSQGGAYTIMRQRPAASYHRART